MIELREALTYAQRLAYVRTMRRAQKSIGKLEATTLKAILRELEQARNQVLGALADATQFGQWHLPQVLRATQDAIEEVKRDIIRIAGKGNEEAFDLGLARTSQAAKTLGINYGDQLVGVAREPLELAQTWTADLVQGETEAALRRITRDIRLGTAGGLSREQLVQRVTGTVTQEFKFGTLRKRSQAIVRTEINRVHNAAHQEGMKRAEASNVKVRKQWISAQDDRVRDEHVQMHGQIVGVDERFEYPGLPESEWPLYPLDPVLPAAASVGCRCGIIELFEVIDTGDADDISVEVSA